MNIGVITSYDSAAKSGKCSGGDGNEVSFSYSDGQSMLYGDDITTPQFSGKHAQPEGFALKIPEVGDSIVFISHKNEVEAWGYANHYVDLVERRHGTSFL